MVQTNSWGRKIKDVISVTFKKDEDNLKAFLNEQPNPADYLKMLVAKDMKNIKFSIPKQVTSEVMVEDKDELNQKSKLDSLSNDAKEKLLSLMGDDE